MSKIGIYTSAIIEQDNKFLLLLHIHIGDPIWLMPGGKPEENEGSEECLRRELKEELDIDIIDCHIYNVYHSVFRGKEWLGIFFKINSFKGTPVLKETQKHSHLYWASFEEMQQMIVGQPEMGISKLLTETV